MAASNSLANNIRRYQAQRGMSCAKFAEYLGVSKCTLSKMRRGNAHFSSSTLEHVASVLGITTSELLAEPASALSDAIVLTAGAFANTAPEKRERAMYHLSQLITLLGPGAQLWMDNLV